MKQGLDSFLRFIGLTIVAFVSFPLSVFAQNTMYFPPIQGNEWDTLHPEELNWCQDSLLELNAFLEASETKAFIVLKGGKRVLETYYGTFSQDSFWYWASAGKTLTAFLIGKASEDGLVDIHKPTAHYLGNGWTSMDSSKEALITPFHQLTMTTGLDFNNPDANCKDPACLQYKSDPGTEWFYYNAPYLLLQDVIESASNQTLNGYTFSTFTQQTGIYGFWNNQGVFFSRPRSMARFGILMANKGNWNGQTILGDTAYINAMVRPSQILNPSYGYLWWLNGQAGYRLPVLTQLFAGSLVSNAPSDMVAAMGRNNQRLYLVPSQDLIVVRMGNPGSEAAFGPSNFDNLLWKKLSNLNCEQNSLNPTNNSRYQLVVAPNPGSGKYEIKGGTRSMHFKVFKSVGDCVSEGDGNVIDLTNHPAGMYFVHIFLEQHTIKICKIAHNP